MVQVGRLEEWSWRSAVKKGIARGVVRSFLPGVGIRTGCIESQIGPRTMIRILREEEGVGYTFHARHVMSNALDNWNPSILSSLREERVSEPPLPV